MRDTSNPQRLRAPAVLAIVVVLCLLIAPVCAPLCAARMCAPSAGQEHCHGMAADTAGQNTLAANAPCRGFELSAVLPRVDQQSAVPSALPDVQVPADLNAHGFARVIPESYSQSGLRSPQKEPTRFPGLSVLRV